MFPNFLCIGAPKAGTTWLFDNLRRHPDVWLPKYKSMQYFSGKAAAVRRKKFRRLLRREVLADMSWRQSLWDLRYFFHPRIDDRWYASLFEAGRGYRAVGEIAPSYSALDDQQVARVRELMPETRVIFFLRNPVERLWSHAMLTVVRNTGRQIERVPAAELRAFIASDSSTKRTDYLETYRRWSQAFGENRVFVGFFEEIAHAPGELLTRVCNFLEIDDDLRHFQQTKDRNIFKGLGCPLPGPLEVELYRQYLDQLEGLAQQFGGPANDWRQYAHSLLGKRDREAA
ncbi:MAG: sulfotransferase [Planctomycetales bacterium]|nr:sulfotransferase [Planctomycetales bacterium]